MKREAAGPQASPRPHRLACRRAYSESGSAASSPADSDLSNPRGHGLVQDDGQGVLFGDHVERLGLRVLCGLTASLKGLPDGWAYEDGARYYRLTLDERPAPAGSLLGLLEAWSRGRYFLAAGDLNVAASRQEFARGFASGDAELEGTVCADLFRLRWTITFARIDAALMAGLEGEEEAVDLLIRGLGRAGRIAIARLARRHGGTVCSRRAT